MKHFASVVELEQAMQDHASLPEMMSASLPKNRAGIIASTLTALEFHVETTPSTSGSIGLLAIRRRPSRSLFAELEAENKALKAQLKALVESQAALEYPTPRPDLAPIHISVTPGVEICP
jgi:hypothetical protein